MTNATLRALLLHNSAGVPVTARGLLNPVIATAGMALSVIVNSVLLMRARLH